jgi:predicted transport protein
MSDMEKALATQLANIEKRSGKSLDELAAIIRASGLAKHGEIRDMLKRNLGLGHGDANTLTHHVLKSDGQSAAAAAGLGADDVVAGLYPGPKAALRPIHDKLMAEINKFGEFEIAPKKTYVSLRRKKQFAMIGPATKTQVEVGINLKNLAPSDRLVEQPPNSMCNYKVRLSTVAEVDATLIVWIKQAFESAG